MRAEARSWDDWSTNNAPPILEEEKWHVALAPGEVKVVSLEQLDDLFRLSIVDAETKVWQNGMSEWQPLRVIAGIDDEPALAEPPKRTHPKPPSPRSAPPVPPRPVASAAVYAAPISLAPAPISFAAPVTPLSSVRPLVVSRAPAAPQRGGGFGRFLVGLAVVAGALVSLYRNDVIRDAAHSAHQDALYVRLEAALGGPAFGTLRSVEQGAPEQSASLPANDGSSTATDARSNTKAAAALVATPLTAAAGATPPVVSLESLTPEKKGVAPSAAPANLPATATRALQASAPAQPKTEAPVLAAKPAAKADPPAKPVKAEKAAPAAPQKSEADMTERERLNAAIGRSMLGSPVKASKSKASEYDPLNPKL